MADYSSILKVDPTSAYKPQLDYLKTLEAKTNERYAQNQAAIKNLFGALSGLGAADTARINKQFTDSITAQQTALASRTATAQAEQKAGEAQAVATGAERGTGPAMVGSPTATATAEGIGRSNAYQTTWEALQNTIKDQAVVDVTNRQAGYGQQQVGALQQLQKNLEDKLLEIGGNAAAVRGDIAKAKFGVAQDVAQAKYSQALSAQDFARQQALAAQRAAASAANAANKPKKYASNPTGFAEKAADAGVDLNALSTYVDAATIAVKKRLQKEADKLNARKGAQLTAPVKASKVTTDMILRELANGTTVIRDKKGKPTRVKSFPNYLTEYNPWVQEYLSYN